MLLEPAQIVRLRVGQERVIVGTVCKDMPARPSVVEEFAGAVSGPAIARRAQRALALSLTDLPCPPHPPCAAGRSTRPKP